MRIVRTVVTHIPVTIHIEHIVRITSIGSSHYIADLPYNNFEKIKDITF